MALSKRDIQRLKTYRTAIPNKLYIEEADRNGRSNYYIGTNDNRLRIISQEEYNNIVNPVTPVINNITNTTGTNFVAGGDLSGTSTNQTVEKILNNTVPPDAAGSLVNDGVGNLSWVAGGAGYITGIDNTGNDVTLAVALGILTANLTSLNISQFTNDSGYLTSVPPDFITSISDTTTIDLDVTGGQLTANFINAAGYVTCAGVPACETDPIWIADKPNYLTSAIAAATYQPIDADLTAIAALGFVSTSFLKKTAANTWALDTNTYLSSVTPHDVLSATHSDTLASAVSRGSIIVGNSTPLWAELNLGSVGKILRSDGSDLLYSTFTIPDTYSQGDLLYASASNVLSALAKDTTATRYLSNQGSSNSPSWNQVNLVNGVTGVLPLANGGTNKNMTAVNGGVVYTDADSMEVTAAGTSGYVLMSNGAAAPTWAAPATVFTSMFYWCQGVGATLNPADSTNYHFGLADATPATTTANRRFKFVNAGSVVTAQLSYLQANNGSNETVTIYLRNVTTATDTSIGTFTSDFGATTSATFNFTGLSITVNNSDYYCIKIACPAWGTNPSGWAMTCLLITQ